MEPQEGEKERLEVRSWCFCTSNSLHGWRFAQPGSGCNPRTPEERQGLERGSGSPESQASLKGYVLQKIKIIIKKKANRMRNGENETEEQFGFCILAS